VTLVGAPSWPASPPAARILIVNLEMFDKSHRASELRGNDILNDRQERIGTIEDIINDRGHALYAVSASQGFRGSQAPLVIIPFSVIELNGDGRKLALPGTTTEELEKLPEHEYAN
jgi:sporulation protein YlmC with PRC-barrel domain